MIAKLMAQVFLVFSLLILAPTASTHAQQASQKLVRVEQVAQITDAVMISNVSVSNKALECGLFIKPPAIVQPVTPFQAGSDWLQQMTISLVNRTNKTIVFGAVLMHFLDTGDCHSLPCVGSALRFGQRPAVDAYNSRTGEPLRPESPERASLNWAPGQTITVHVKDYIDEIQNDLANFMSVTAVSRLNIYRGVFYFNDGTQWDLGGYAVPEAGHPGKFKKLPADFFPGRRETNWPPGYDR